MIEALALKIEGCMHPLPKIDGGSCTCCTHSNKDPVIALELKCDNMLRYLGCQVKKMN